MLPTANSQPDLFASCGVVGIYVLQLADGCYYVGQSATPAKRIKKHFAGKGSAWTRLHRPLHVVRQYTFAAASYREAEHEENRRVLELVAIHGWQNVRGGFFSSVDEEEHRKNLLAHGFIF